MSPADGQVIVCLVPPKLEKRLVEPLRKHYKDDPRVIVIVERRERQRRASRDDTTTQAGRDDRRTGGDRRRPVLPRNFAPPPKKLKGIEQVTFVQRLVPVGEVLGMADDDAVVQRVREGDPQAPAELYWRYYARVHSRLSVILGDTPEVHAAVGPAFGRVLDALEDPANADVPFDDLLYAAVDESVAARHAGVPGAAAHPLESGLVTLELSDPNLDEPVVVSERDPNWFHRGMGERDRFLRKLADHDVTIEHIGSTAVPAIPARPIIDLLVGVDDGRTVGTVRSVLTELGYEDCGDGGVYGRTYLRRRGLSRFDVHVVERDSPLFSEPLVVREFLRRHPSEAHRWGQAKREAARGGSYSSLRYFELRREALADLAEKARVAIGESVPV